MIKLKTEVVKKHLIEQLKAEAELTYKNSWQPKLQERAFIDGAEALFKLLRLGDVSNRSKTKRVSSDGVFFRCDNCGHEPKMASITDDLLIMNFCPKCGSEFE